MANAAVGIQNPLVEAFMNALDNRFADLLANTPDKVPVIVDSVNSDVLPLLAAQFDVLGYKGWKLATTDQQRREVIKNAIASHKHRGTVAAMEFALRSVGYDTGAVVEGIAAQYNGVLRYNGATTYGSTDWAHFGILINLGEQAGVDPGSIADLVEMVKVHKNARSLLVKIGYEATLSDDALQTDEVGLIVSPALSDTALEVPRYDGQFRYDGMIQYNGQPDSFGAALRLNVEDTATVTDSGGMLSLVYTAGLTQNIPL